MELNVLEKKKTRLVFELPGADHTLCAALKSELWQDKDVTVATYTIKHPLLAVPKFILETKAGEPKKALTAACKRLEKQLKTEKIVLAKV